MQLKLFIMDKSLRGQMLLWMNIMVQEIDSALSFKACLFVSHILESMRDFVLKATKIK
jgi:hypothetical protein